MRKAKNKRLANPAGDLSSPDLLELIGAAHGAVTHPDGWLPFFKLLRTKLGATATGITFRDHLGVDQRWVGLDPAFERAYVEKYHTSDPWVQAAQASPPPLNTVLLGHKLVTPELLRRSECYQKLCVPHGLLDLVSVILSHGNDGMVYASIFFDAVADARVMRAAAVLNALLPTLIHAVDMSARIALLDAQVLAQQDMLENAGVAALVVSSGLRVLRANARARAMMSTGDVIRSGDAHGVRVVDAHVHQKLHEAARAGVALRVVVPGDKAHPNRVLVAAPLAWGAPLAGGARCLAVYVVDTQGGRRSPVETLRVLYGLTQAEARMAEQLGQGLTPQSAAAAQGISWNTARTHLKRVLSKTGTHRQAQLVRLMASLSFAEDPR